MLKQQTWQSRRPLSLSAVLALAALSTLAACGGDDPQLVPLDPATLKGRWVSPAGVAPAITAVLLPDTSSTANAWLLAQDASRLVKLVVRSDSSANGMSYALNQTNATGQTVTGRITPTPTINPKHISFTGVNATALVLDQSDTLSFPAVQADAAGSWNATAGNKAQTTQWAVAADGGISGSSTTGCSHTGNLTVLTSNAYGVQFSESCPDGGNTTFNGIATLDTPKTRLTVVATSADATLGIAVFFAK